MNKLDIDWTVVGLGTKTDKLIAKELGINSYTVFRKRKELNIPSFYSTTINPFTKEELIAKGLGQKPDQELAQELNVLRATLSSWRRKWGIESFKGFIFLQEEIPCRSIYEAKFDAYLHWKNIPHKHEVKIKELPYIPDFQIDDYYVEVACMRGYGPYDKRMKMKQEEYIKYNLDVKWLNCENVNNLFKFCDVELKFRKRVCQNCGQQITEKGKFSAVLCRICYKKKMYWSHKIKNKCSYCQKIFYRGTKRKFCSRLCFSKDLEKEWPTLKYIEEALKIKSKTQIAKEIGVSRSGLRKHLEKIKKI